MVRGMWGAFNNSFLESWYPSNW